MGHEKNIIYSKFVNKPFKKAISLLLNCQVVCGSLMSSGRAFQGSTTLCEKKIPLHFCLSPGFNNVVVISCSPRNSMFIVVHQFKSYVVIYCTLLVTIL